MSRGRVLAYKRVSSLEQNASRQLEGVEYDLEFEDRASGKDTERPKLQELLRTAYKGDKVLVHSMDRLARNLRDLQTTVDNLVANGAEVTFIKEQLTFSGNSNAMATLMLQMMGAFAEFERSMIRSRQAEGIAIAKARGVYQGRGRKRVLTDDKVLTIKARVEAGEKKTVIAADLGVSREAIYKALKRP